MKCPACGAKNESGAHFCTTCGGALPEPTRASPTSKISSFLLSLLLPGLGQFYNADIRKGFIFISLWLLGVFSMFASAGLLSWIPLLVNLWSAIDAYRIPSRRALARI